MGRHKLLFADFFSSFASGCNECKIYKFKQYNCLTGEVRWMVKMLDLS